VEKPRRLAKMKKYQDGGGIREGRATSIKDDVRERARKAIKENMEREERGVEAMPIAMPRKSKPTSLTPTSPTPTSPTPTSPTPKAKSKAEEARDKMFERNGPIGDAIDGIKNSELVKKLRGSMNIDSMQGRFRGKTDSGMKKGGAVKSSASKRGDGCAIRGKTKGMMR
jgi:hypothetical protein